MKAIIIRLFRKWSATRKTTLAVIVLGVAGYLFCLPEQLFQVPYSTVVTDRNGELLGARIAADGQWRFPPRTTATPRKMAQCLIAFEDRNFYRHWGVDLPALARALYQNIQKKHIVSGGSTLTMQTIRLARKRPRTWSEKLIEIILATRLEFRASKEEILSLYVSHAPFGGNVVGLDAAAWRYFGHSAEELSWGEAALLAVLPNAPASVHLSKARETLLQKRNRVLKRLHEKEIIDRSTYELAIGEPLPEAPHPLPQTATHAVDRFYQGRNGLRSVSTLDRSLQLQVESLAERWNREFSRSDIRDLAILVIDLRNNEAVAYCGNARSSNMREGSQVDIIRSPRSTGSVLKPFLYYAMLQEGTLLPDMLLPDIPTNINGFTPRNFSQKFEGAVPASEALARSLNIPAVHMLQQFGVPRFYQFLQQAGLTTLCRPASHYGLSLILGGAEATLWDITQAYARMGRSLLGLPQTPCRLSLHPATTTQTDNQPVTDIFQPGASWQTLEALTEVNRPEEIDWKAISSIQTIAWKTGTSYGFRDAWAVGITPGYAVGVWVGNATGEGKPGLIGAQTAGPVLFDVFNLLPATRWFERPAGIFIDAEVCRQSGHLKGRFCEGTDSVLILPAGLKSEVCPYHHPVTLSADESHRVYESSTCNEPVIHRSWFTLPPVWEWYYRQHHPEYRPLPPLRQGENGGNTLLPMQFIYPPMNARITLPRQLDGTPGFLTAEVAYRHTATTIFWHIDDSYLTCTKDFHQITLQPPAGKHVLTVVDEEGNSISVSFYVE